MRFLDRFRFTIIVVLFLCLSLTLFDSNGECSAEKDYILGIGDIIKIQVWGNDDLNRTVEISQEGAFTFPLIGKINALGLSVFETETLIEKRLGSGYLVSPQLSVSVEEYKSQKVFVFGEVKRPGAYIIKGATPLLEVIASADGFADGAGQAVKIIRSQKTASERAPSKSDHEDQTVNTVLVDLRKISLDNLDKAYWVSSGDSVYVEKNEQFFVIGEVNNPGRFIWKDGLTIHQAISLAGGPTKRASMGRTKIVRVIDGKERTISPDMNELAKPDDIVKVPESYF